MEPSSKRRRLAPKVPEPPPPHPQPQLPPPPPQVSGQTFSQEQHAHFLPQEPIPPPPERRDFEAFARHLQDAAMHIYRQTQKSHYSSVSVLLLRWEDDGSVENDLRSLEKVFRERYRYRTDVWHIPTVPNPSIKLGVQMASFLEHASSDHLSIIYYAGHGYLGHDGQLYWACSSREDASKLKWDGVRCLFEDAQSDMLLLLDSCAVRDAPTAGSHGVKQAMAAYSPEQHGAEPGLRSFTASLVDSLHKLSTGRPFTVEKLYEDIMSRRQADAAQRSANGAFQTGSERMPLFLTLTPPNGRGLSLVPLVPRPAPQAQSSSVIPETEGGASSADRDIHGGGAEPVVDLTFDEQRVLVCTTFVGDASPDMTFFNQWLHKPPAVAAKVSVEGMFLGPPTMLMISMPQSIWSVVQHDKVCCFLGLVSSHNMIHLYNRLVDSAAGGAARNRDVEDGRILLEAREAAAGSPGMIRRERMGVPPVQPDLPNSKENAIDLASGSQSGASGSSSVRYGVAQATGTEVKDEVEDSAEMQEAAEQLKALRDVRHMKDNGTSSTDIRGPQIGDNIEVRQEDAQSSPDGNESGPDEGLLTADGARAKARRPLQKQISKTETRCTHCSHAPFKDSSSLRKHVAAAHTRPFPCAFSFAGCTSTFGSKNEWKRHIASQHLCLQYYRCSSCPQGNPEGKGNEFNRKDLFTQHLRRMHAPFAIKKAIDKNNSKLQADWETHVKEMQLSCLVQRRQPPQRSACPKPGCQSVFEGPGSWDEWTEHVGRHMEKGEAQKLGVDPLLKEWALEECIIEQKSDGVFKLCNGGGIGSAEREAQAGNNSFISETGRTEDDDPSITVAIPIPREAP